MSDAKGSRIPMDPGYIQQKEETEDLPNSDQYQSLVGSLLYLAVNTRPDLGICASILGRKVSKPTKADWTEAKRALRYLKETVELKLHLGGGSGELEGYADADWASTVQDRKSNSGYLFRLGGGTILWGAKKQTCVALSSTEAEYISLAQGCQELLWLRKLLLDFGESVKGPTRMKEDNQSCIKLVTGSSGKRSKHVETKYHFIKNLAERKVISLEYCPTELMLADILTKPLNRVRLEQLRAKMGLQPTCAEEE
ncbi:uncharacterized protein LOC129752181 [Uranotaenia lowii]|uniref:uncharacterized protein LOC129752181 n=1 Tax=Uranotaenia lowii TaxID=190385 RepID=UPI00247A69DA|nr:uncharacterized protein LOC129752181 [Uranotaenia lowii]